MLNDFTFDEHINTLEYFTLVFFWVKLLIYVTTLFLIKNLILVSTLISLKQGRPYETRGSALIEITIFLKN